MPKKKTPKNAFYFFMLDFRDEQEQMGHVFHGGLKEVADMAGPSWKEVTPEQRIYYESLAAREKLKDKTNMENKFTTTGVSYAQVEREDVERRSYLLRRQLEMEGTVQGLDRDSTLKTHAFYFIHFNYYCRIEDGSYLICEVALARFNLKEGVKDVYHTLIRQDKIPTGYSFEARQTSDDTHQIPMPQDLEEGEPYRGGLFCYIKSFLEQNKMSNGALPPLYSIDSHVEVAQNALTCLAEFHYPQDPEVFRVYPLSKLFFLLRNAASPSGAGGFPSETLAERELDKDQYNFAPGIACSLHEQNDTCVYCSKSIVQRWAFLICDHCCRDLGIPMLRGRHVPINAAINVELVQEEVAAVSSNGDFQEVQRRGPRSSRAARGGPLSTLPPTASSPTSVMDYSPVSLPEENPQHFTLNAAAADFSPRGRAPSTGKVGSVWGGRGRGDHVAGNTVSSNASGAGSASVGGAWGRNRPGNEMEAASGGSVWGRPTPAAPPPTAMDVTGSNSGSGSFNKNGAIPKSTGSCWGARSSGEAIPPHTLRHPTSLPPSIANALRFTEADFPDLGGGRNHSRTPAAVAGRGRGRTRMLMDDSGSAPGQMKVTEDEVDPNTMGRGRGSRLAANFPGLNHN